MCVWYKATCSLYSSIKESQNINDKKIKISIIESKYKNCIRKTNDELPVCLSAKLLKLYPKKKKKWINTHSRMMIESSIIYFDS